MADWMATAKAKIWNYAQTIYDEKELLLKRKNNSNSNSIICIPIEIAHLFMSVGIIVRNKNALCRSQRNVHISNRDKHINKKDWKISAHPMES